jgi:hypothetical protein
MDRGKASREGAPQALIPVEMLLVNSRGGENDTAEKTKTDVHSQKPISAARTGSGGANHRPANQPEEQAAGPGIFSAGASEKPEWEEL